MRENSREMGNTNRVLVVGGGIAGLATARALTAHGIDCDVVERAAAWSHPGTGMYLPANAVRALGDLGLEAALCERAVEIGRQRFLDQRGRPLLDVDLATVWGTTGPCLAIEHRDLHEILRDGIPVRLDTTITALQDEGSQTRAAFSDGSSDLYDLVVGADGVRSWVGTEVFTGSEPQFVKQTPDTPRLRHSRPHGRVARDLEPRRRRPRGELRPVEGAGHVPWLDDSTGIADEVDQCLGE